MNELYKNVLENSLISFYHGSEIYGVLKTKESDHDVICIVSDIYLCPHRHCILCDKGIGHPDDKLR